jgi:flagellar hook protein FlgE
MSFSTALSGLNAASADLNVKSNNIANVSTTGFKQSRAEFGDVFAVSAFGSSSGTAIGSGVVLQNVSQQFNQGNLEFTDNSLDLAISGEGFFSLAPSIDSGEVIYTRAGEFGIDKDGYVVNSQGNFLRTFPVDVNGVISATSIDAAKALQLPTSAGAPESTSLLSISSNLPSNAVGINVPAVTLDPGTFTSSAALTLSDFSNDQVSFQVDGNAINLNSDYSTLAGVANAIQTQLPAGYTAVLNTSNNLLITAPTDSAPVISAFNGNADGDSAIADFTGGTATAGSAADPSSYLFSAAVSTVDYSVNPVSFDVTSNTGSTSVTANIVLNSNYTNLAGVAAAIQTQLNNAVGAGGFGASTYAVSEASGVLNISTTNPSDEVISTGNYVGNTVTISDFTAGTGVNGTATASAAAVLPINPLDPTTYSNSTSATVFDSLGNEHIITTYYQKIDGEAEVGGVLVGDNKWQLAAYITSDDIKVVGGLTTTQTDGSTTLVQLGTTSQISFNTDGSLNSTTPDPIVMSFDAANGTEFSSGASDQVVTLNLTGSTQNSGGFSVGGLTVNGFPTGRLTGVDISDDGLIRATYSNGQALPIGKIALGNFANPQALNKIGSTAWKETTDSGPVIAGEAGSGSFGQIQSGALETSNVDLTKELVGLITAQRNFQANSKAIETNNAITQTIIQLR